MEKLIYALWQDKVFAEEDLRRALHGEEVEALHINLADADVAAGAGLIQNNSGALPAAFVSFWLHTAQERGAVEARLAEAAARIAGYVVSESVPIRSPHATGGRTPGFCQVALLQKPARLRRNEWLHIWLNSHTQVAIDTQSTFYYCQNVVTRRLHDHAPPWDAIVEEGFPETALTDPAVFFDAVDDAERLDRHIKEMMASCARFIDFDTIDVLPTSQYT